MKAKRERWKIIVPLLVLWIGILVSSALTAVFRTHDSESYTGPISFVGNYTRGWPTVALYHLFPPDTLAVIAQTIIYGGAWTVLLIAWSLRRTDTVHLVFGVLLVALALTPAMVGWSVTILAEPLTISLILLGIGLLGFALQPASREMAGVDGEGSGNSRGTSQKGETGQRRLSNCEFLFLAGAALCFSLAAINRITVLPLVLVPVIALAISLRKLPRGVGAATGAALLSIVFIAYPVYFSSESNKAWSEHFGATRTTIYFYYGTAVTEFSPLFANYVFFGVIDGGPGCLRGYRASFEGSGPFEVVDRLTRECPAGARWVDEEFNQRYAQTLIDHPRLTLDHLRRAVPETTPGLGFSQALYGTNQVVTILPTWVFGLFGSSVSDQAKRVLFLLWSGFGGLIVVCGLVFRRIRTRRWWAGSGLFLASGLGVILTVLALADELSRTAAPATAALLVASVLLLQEAVSSHRQVELERKE